MIWLEVHTAFGCKYRLGKFRLKVNNFARAISRLCNGASMLCDLTYEIRKCVFRSLTHDSARYCSGDPTYEIESADLEA